MLQKQVIPVDVSGGLDTKTDSYLVSQGSALTIENGVFNKGSVITKRNGYIAYSRNVLGSATKISQGSAFGTFKDELFLFDGSKFYSYIKAIDQWINKGNFTSVGVSRFPIVRNISEQKLPDVAIYNGITLYAWEDGTDIRCSLVEVSSGSILINNALVSSSGTYHRCINIGTHLFVIFRDGTNLKGRRLDPNNNSQLEAEFTISTSVATPYYFDIIKFGNNAIWAHCHSGGIRVGYLTPEKAVGDPTNLLPSPTTIAKTASHCLSLYANATKVWFAYHNDTNGLESFSIISDLSASSAVVIDGTKTPDSITNVTMAEDTSNNIVYFYQVYPSGVATYNHYVSKNTLTLPSTVGTPAVLKRSVGLASRAFVYSSTIYVCCSYDSDLQASYFVLNSSGTIISKHLSNNGGGHTSSNLPFLSSVISIDTGVYRWAALEKTKLVSDGGKIFTYKGVTSIGVDFLAENNFWSDELGGNLHISGGYLSAYDGAQVVEHGFHLFPENVTTSPTTSTGNIADGSYQYCVCYEWTDNQGQVHYSAPSIATTATMSGGGGNGKFTLTIPTLRLTSKSVLCSVFRTIASGSVFFKVASVANNTAADTVSYADIMADATLESKEILYTTGGILDNISPPSVSVIVAHKDRLFAISAEDPKTLWYSKTLIPGEPVAFSDFLTITVNSEGGNLVNMMSMDGNLILFKERRISALSGEGPTNAGIQNDYGPPQLIASDVGCKDANSIVGTPDGIMFKSDKGIYFLSRSLQVSYIGAPVEAYNSYVITSAVIVENNNQVRFTTANGVCLVYDYFFKKWSTFTNHAAVDATEWLGDYVYLRSDAQVYQEIAGIYKDKLDSIRMKIGTSWLALNGIQGFQRVWRFLVLGKYKSKHTLKVSVYYDYEAYPGDTYEFKFSDDIINGVYGDDLYGTSYTGDISSGVFQFSGHLSNQKCQSIMFEFEDITSDVYGESFTLSVLSLEIGAKTGAFKLSATKRSASTVRG